MKVPRYVTIGLFVQWVIIDVLWSQGFSYLHYLYHMGTMQFHGNEYDAIFPFTYASALALFLFGVYAFRFRLRLDWLRTVIFSVSLPFAATSLFEETYQDIGVILHVANITPSFSSHVINVSSVLFGLVSMGYWRRSRIFYATAFAYVLLWGIWVGLGYPQIYEQSSFNFVYLINAVLKVMSYSLFALLVAGRFLIHDTPAQERRK
ncbi:MAG: hypothetical protein ACYC7D_04595 [Nitrososphaerales archaeon]